MSDVEKVPAALQNRYDEIVSITDAFCAKHLNEEYKALCRKMTAKLCRKRPSPITNGKANSWACGIIYALGKINYLFDKHNKPHMRADRLCELFDLGTSTATAKSKSIIDALRIGVFDSTWALSTSPTAWLISVDGFMLDARQCSREIQEEAFRLGLIPYIP